MAIMETIKWLMFYGMEIVVVALVGIALLAGLYQLAQGKARQRRASSAPETAETTRRFTNV